MPFAKIIDEKYRLSENNLLHKIHRYMGVVLLTFLFPFQWIIGILHFEEGLDYFQVNFNSGHAIPAFGFYFLGMMLIWNSKIENDDKIFKIERTALIIFAPMELIGELMTHKPIWYVFIFPSIYHFVVLVFNCFFCTFLINYNYYQSSACCVV